MYQLATLGRLTVSHAGAATPISPLPRKALGLLAILAASGPTSRDRLMALLWPESDLDRARGSLKKAVHQLRQQLGGSDPVRGSAILELNPTAIATDIAQFKEALAQGNLSVAVAVYGGPFLDGLDLQGGVELEHWIDATRFALQAAWAGAVEQLAEQAESAGLWPAASARWRTLQDAAPADSRVASRLMRALDAAGQTAAALAHAQVHQGIRREEWDLPPDVGVTVLDRALRAGMEPSGAASLTRVVEAPTSRLDRVTGTYSGPSRRRRVIAATTLVAAACFAVLLLRRPVRATPVVGNVNLMVVAPFHVPDTSLELWREGLPDLLVRALDGAGPLQAVRGPVAFQDWDGAGDRNDFARLGARLGAALVLYGALVRTSADSVMLTGTVLDRESGGIVVDVGVRGSEMRLGELTDSLTFSILRAMGRDRAIAATRRGSLVARSLPALREFLRGEQFYRRDEVDSAMAHYHQAIVEDPDLAMAHRRLGWLIAANREIGAAYGAWRDHVTRAIALSHGLNPRDSLLLLADSLKLAIERSSSPAIAMRDWFTRLDLLEGAGQRFPFDAGIWAELGEARFHERSPLGDRPADAFAAFKRAVELDPGYALAYWHIVDLAFRAGQPDLAGRYARAASRLDPAGVTGSMVLTSLVLDSGVAASATRRAIATASPRVLFEVANDRVGWMADSAEAAVIILRELAARDDPVARAVTVDPKLRFRFVATALAFRGHLRAAAATGLDRSTNPAASGVDAVSDPFAELVMLGVVAESFAQAEFARAFDERLSWGTLLNPNGSPRFLRGVPWWYSQGDTVSLQRFEARARAVAITSGEPVARLRGRYYAGIARGYIALARGDSTGARRMLEAVPDSLCVATPCLPEKRLLARLLITAGDDRGAARLLDQWSASRLPGNTVSQVLVELERGGIAERLADTVRARRAYKFVGDVWRNADPELDRYVRSARQGLERLAGLGPKRRVR